MAEHAENQDRLQALMARRQAAALLHDINSPLLTIRTLSQLLLEDEKSNRTEVATRIEAQVDRIGRLLDAYWQMLDHTIPASTDPATGIPQTTGSTGMATGPLEILLVEDDDIHQEVGRRLLAQMGHHVTLCESGADALRLCKSRHFDIVFVDQHGPNMLGTEFARAQRAAAHAAGRPRLVGMSCDPRTDEMRSECLLNGMQDYLEKPLTRDKLATILDSLFNQRPHAG
ncbi:MAG: hybrid sensor histidine kinase/response regulator [Alphaproteobacteria bacterium]|nr:MAG: hybrid sensor histidine kinase/response regulator [Alphaproteobacteria bacterium]